MGASPSSGGDPGGQSLEVLLTLVLVLRSAASMTLENSPLGSSALPSSLLFHSVFLTHLGLSFVPLTVWPLLGLLIQFRVFTLALTLTFLGI